MNGLFRFRPETGVESRDLANLDRESRNPERPVKFARDLRIKLWAEHLGWHRRMPMAEARLGDIDRAVEYLTTRRPAGARLSPYNLSAGAGTSYPLLWDNYVDPDGSSAP